MTFALRAMAKHTIYRTLMVCKCEMGNVSAQSSEVGKNTHANYTSLPPRFWQQITNKTERNVEFNSNTVNAALMAAL